MITEQLIMALANAYKIAIIVTRDDWALIYRVRIENKDHKTYVLDFPYNPEEALDEQSIHTFICDSLISCIYKWELAKDEPLRLGKGDKND